eukprot:SAG11_NODE_31230_length_293_cov_1.721649_2_plen_43_part_01
MLLECDCVDVPSVTFRQANIEKHLVTVSPDFTSSTHFHIDAW